MTLSLLSKWRKAEPEGFYVLKNTQNTPASIKDPVLRTESVSEAIFERVLDAQHNNIH